MNLQVLLTPDETFDEILNNGGVFLGNSDDYILMPDGRGKEREYLKKLADTTQTTTRFWRVSFDLVEEFEPTINYKSYIQSKEWKKKAKAAKERAGWRCQLCNNDGALHAHHRTYEHLGAEKDEDITVLCAECHSKFHNIGGGK